MLFLPLLIITPYSEIAWFLSSPKRGSMISFTPPPSIILWHIPSGNNGAHPKEQRQRIEIPNSTKCMKTFYFIVVNSHIYSHQHACILIWHMNKNDTWKLIFLYSSMQNTWPWPPVDRLCHDLIILRQKETWT